MTCHHLDGDPNCTTLNPAALAAKATALYERWVPSPDNTEYEILEVVDVNQHVVLRVKYKSCE